MAPTELDGSLGAASDQLEATANPGHHPVAVGHGMILYSDGTFREPTAQVLRESQSYLIKRLQSEATPDVKARLTREVPRASKTAALTNAATPAGAVDPGQLEADAEVLDWLVRTVAPRDASVLDQLSRFIRREAAQSRRAANTANSNGVASLSSAIVSTTSGTQYAAECIAAGVPHPPPFGSSYWEKRVVSGNSLLTPNFLSGIAEVYVHTSTSPRGVCIALPRRTNTADQTINLLGIICQGNDTSRACFWDSKALPESQKIRVGEVVNIPGDKMIGGKDLLPNGGGECTDCHAGENAFITHPGSLLDIGADLIAKNWVRPLIDPSWVQNVGPGKELQRLGGTCSTASCHSKGAGRRFPRLEDVSGYCGIARTALGSTMPESAAHRTALNDLCTPRPLASRFKPTITLWNATFSPNSDVPRVGDVNGDGRDDIISVASNGSVSVALSTGSGFGTPSVWRTSFAALTEQINTGDFNGDGREDLVTARMNSTGQVFVSLSSGTAFGTPTNFGGHVKAGEVYMTGDVNGDRKDDLVVFTKGTTNDVLVQLSNGSSFGPSQLWHGNFSPGAQVPMVGDFNADGYDDIVSFTRGSTSDVIVALSNGSSFGTATTWNTNFGLDAEIQRVADVTGDGRDDVVTFNRSTRRVSVAISLGNSFYSSAIWHTYFAHTGELPFLADVDADHRADAVLFTKGSTADVLVSLAVP